MARLFDYTDGREGSHGVLLCKEVEDGRLDTQNVPIDIANDYIIDGYYQCDAPALPTVTPTAAPSPTPAPTPVPAAATPAPSTPVPSVTVKMHSQPSHAAIQEPEVTPAAIVAPTASPEVSVHTAVASPQPLPTTLPQTGAGSSAFIVAMAIAGVATGMYLRRLYNKRKH